MFPTLLMLSGEAPLLDFTPGGQVIVSLLSIFSLVIMATATGILASGFEAAMRETKEKSHALELTRRVLRKHIKKEARSQRNIRREAIKRRKAESDKEEKKEGDVDAAVVIEMEVEENMLRQYRLNQFGLLNSRTDSSGSLQICPSSKIVEI